LEEVALALGNLYVRDATGSQVPEKLGFQFGTVHQHQNGGVMESWLLD
jgi:hypothetical protein